MESWEHEESKVPNIEGFVLWSSWNKKSYQIEGISCYLKNNVSPHIWLHKMDPLNQHIWIEISYINAKNIYIECFYFMPINPTFYKKNNLDKNCSYNTLDQDIHSLRNEDNIIMLGYFIA
jgi:hypothetical protein